MVPIIVKRDKARHGESYLRKLTSVCRRYRSGANGDEIAADKRESSTRVESQLVKSFVKGQPVIFLLESVNRTQR